MTISKRRGLAGRIVRRSSKAHQTSTTSTSGARNLSAASFPGDGAIPSTRRKIARAAGKVSPKLNRELA